MRVALALLVALVVAPAAWSAPAPRTTGVDEALGSFAPRPSKPRLTEKRVTRAFLAEEKVADWLRRYPPRPVTDARYDKTYRFWTVHVWSGRAGEVATGRVDDASGVVTEAWTGPQVAWKMARGGADGVFGGDAVNSTWLWLTLSAVFVAGLANLRRPLSLRNLDLLALVSFGVSLWFFNRGEIFTSVSLVYPPLFYLLGRMVWIAVRPRPATFRPLWPAWLLAAAAVFLTGFKIGLNVEDSNVIDVGYSGVVGAHRIANGEAPYGHMPVEEKKLEPCGRADDEGTIRDRVQTNGRCESANPRGDTYGPVAYLAYVPGYLLFGWSGKWDDLPAAHFASIAFDVLCVIGLALVGLRLGGRELGASLAFAWAAYPFTLYASSSNTNDALVPALLVFSFLLAGSTSARGASLALSAWTKFAPLVLAPLWLTYSRTRRRLREQALFAGGFAAASVVAFSVLLLEPDVLHALRVFWDRTIGWQLGRESPFSIWGWGQYHAAGIPDLHVAQQVLKGLLVVAALAVAFVPRRKSLLQLAALSAALLIGFEAVLTHWFYLYLPWFFPFVALAVLWPQARRTAAADEAIRVAERDAGTPDSRETLVGAGLRAE